MKHTVFASLEEMLAPETLSELVGTIVTDARCIPVDWSGVSGSHLFKVETNQGQGARYVLKQVSAEWDWMMRVTKDQYSREVALWQHGLMDQLPPGVSHVIIACAQEGSGWAILMKDAGPEFLSGRNKVLSISQNDAVLDGLAATHATFWNQPFLADTALGLCSLKNYLGLTAPRNCRDEIGSHGIVQYLIDGWGLMKDVFDPDVVSIANELLENPEPLSSALSHHPHTLVHGDYWVGNVRAPKQLQDPIVVLDWQLAAFAPPIIDLAWYIGITTMPISKDEAIRLYKRKLLSHLGNKTDLAEWQQLLDLGMLAGFFRMGFFLVHNLLEERSSTHREYWQEAADWWSERVRAGAKHLRL